ncbi:MAG TPA: GFA family protein [Roseiarcus sp.]|nr:GFA family protein [Roseiarcus sp.]
MIFKGQCHCGAIGVALMSDRPPAEQRLGACQCSFCRKHNARAFSDPGARVTLTAADPEQLQRYVFDLRTSEQIICRRCGVYVAMTLIEEDRAWSVINVDALDDRALFTRAPVARDYSAEDREGRIARRKARWCPTTLVGWPEIAAD